MTNCETFVIEQVWAGAAVIGLYPATEQASQDAYAAWRKEKGL
jgi:hypothetical protein